MPRLAAVSEDSKGAAVAPTALIGTLTPEIQSSTITCVSAVVGVNYRREVGTVIYEMNNA